MSKIFELIELSAIVEKLKKQKNKIVLSHGVFDLLHIGHSTLKCQKLGDK